MRKATQSFIDKQLVFAGNPGEDSKDMEKRWPFRAPKLNNMEDREEKDVKKSD